MKDSLWEEYRRVAPQTNFSCGGAHRCGKCVVFVDADSFPIYQSEKELLTKRGIEHPEARLACFHKEDAYDGQISSSQNGDKIEVLGVTRIETVQGVVEAGVAIDIGTTTVAIAFIDLESNKVFHQELFLNPQVKYGSDVISRIVQSHTHGVGVLRKDLIDLINQKINRYKEQEKFIIERILVAGNATMTHIYMNIDPEPLGVYPFKCPVDEIKEITISESGLTFADDARMLVLPPISAFVGSDILSGIVSIEAKDVHSSYFLIDLGTNGEIVLHRDGTYFCTSTATGPAFEGGNMTHGMPCISGAIQHVEFDGRWYPTIVGGDVAKGICGSGYIEIIDKARNHGMIVKDGRLEEPLFITDTLFVSQMDIRNFQLAKSAIFTAIQFLLKEAGIKQEEVAHIFISGGFSQGIDLNAFERLGILPTGFAKKAEIIGNSSLNGLIEIMHSCNPGQVERVKKNAKTIELNMNRDFNDEFLANLDFPNNSIESGKL